MIWRVTKEEVSTQYLYVEAPSAEKAREIADGLSSESWRESQDWDSRIVEAVKANPSELKGRIIETETGYYNYK